MSYFMGSHSLVDRILNVANHHGGRSTYKLAQTDEIRRGQSTSGFAVAMDTC